MTRRSPRARRACRLSPIHLVTTHAGGPMLVPGLTLHAQSDGLTVISPTGWVVRAAPWAEVHAVVPGASLQEPNGTLRRLLEVRIGERRHRFLAPAAAVAPFVREVASLRGNGRPHRSLGIRMVSSLGLRPGTRRAGGCVSRRPPPASPHSHSCWGVPPSVRSPPAARWRRTAPRRA